MKDEVMRIDTVDAHARLFGLETLHPLVNVVDMSAATSHPNHFTINYGLYALFLKQTMCGDIRYGRQAYDYQEGTIVSFAPGQVTEVNMAPGTKPAAMGLLFHPDLIRGTALGRDIKSYTFFSYSSREALHLSDEERDIILDCLAKARNELIRPVDKLSKRLIASHIQLLLDYCMRFYNRQFVTRAEAGHDVLVRFEDLLDSYFREGRPRTEGLPSVRYFADKVCLSPNYFGDLVKKASGRTPQEYIQGKMMDAAKDLLLASGKTVSEIAEELGFQYPQHFNRVFKKHIGVSPNQYRRGQEAHA